MGYGTQDEYIRYMAEMQRRLAIQSQAMNGFPDLGGLRNAFPAKPKDELDRNSQLLLLEGV